MKRTIEIMPEANQDMMEIWLYSYWNFGEYQADQHSKSMHKLFFKLAVHELGRKRPELGKQVYSIPYGQHSIIYRTEPANVIIGRILHHSQDATAITFSNLFI